MKQRKIILRAVVLIAFITVMFLPIMTDAGSLEPSGQPAPTMKTLDEIPPTWSQTIAGAERFELVLGGAGVLDKETGLVWEQSPSTSTYTWLSAISHCAALNVGARKGWHLPTIEQLASLVDSSQSNPSLPSGHPFSNVQSNGYWSATTYAGSTASAWRVYFYNGIVDVLAKTFDYYAWCVRGGQSHDAY